MPKERVFTILRDSGANFVKGLNLIDIPHLSCFAHSLQLVVEDGLKTQRAVVNVIANVRKIVSHFNHSILAKQRLSAIQARLDIPHHSILQSVPTRWNSMYAILERALEQKMALALYATEHGGIQDNIPSS